MHVIINTHIPNVRIAIINIPSILSDSNNKLNMYSSPPYYGACIYFEKARGHVVPFAFESSFLQQFSDKIGKLLVMNQIIHSFSE